MYFALGTLHHGATLCAEAKGIFVGMRPEIFAKLVEIRKANQIPATELTREQVTETVLAFCELFLNSRWYGLLKQYSSKN